MRIEFDLTQVPPAVTLHDPEDFTSLKVVAAQPEHAFVGPGVLEALAGEHATDPEWRAGLAAMLRYADEHGWVREDGSVRAHVDWQ
jgi:hypothetical protein